MTATSICKHETQSKWADEEEDEGCAVFQSGRSLVSCTNVSSLLPRLRHGHEYGPDIRWRSLLFFAISVCCCALHPFAVFPHSWQHYSSILRLATRNGVIDWSNT